jgi:hypothetical protein
MMSSARRSAQCFAFDVVAIDDSHTPLYARTTRGEI